MVALDAFDYAWLIGLACFGIHLVLLGSLVMRSSDGSKVLGVVLMIAGIAYVTDTIAHALLANYDDFETGFLVLVAVPSVIGEMWLGLWLLLRVGTTEIHREPGKARCVGDTNPGCAREDALVVEDRPYQAGGRIMTLRNDPSTPPATTSHARAIPSEGSSVPETPRQNSSGGDGFLLQPLPRGPIPDDPRWSGR